MVLLAVLAGVTVAAFVATRAVAHGNEDLRRRQAAAWFEAAQRASQDGHTESAVTGLRRAVSKDPGHTQYRLALAAALATTGADEEAKRVLLLLRESQPEDPETNLQLARLESRGPDIDAARRYYENAVAALWRPEQAERRRQVRTDLIEFLIAHDQRARALSELLALAANLPQDAGVQVHVARMYLAAGNPRLALDHYLSALRLEPKSPEALAGAGQAAFEIADYSRALRYLDAVPGGDPQVAELRDVARLAITADPLAPRLQADERHRRLMAALAQAMHRLDVCLGDPPVEAPASFEALRQEAHAFQASLRLPRAWQSLVHDGIDLVYRIEQAVERHCAAMTPAPLDRALLLIGRRHGFGEP